MVVDLNSLSFGALAAENDRALADYFVESESYTRLRQGDRAVVLGPRGSGKSAIFKMIAKHERDAASLVVELAPTDYSYQLFKDTLAAEGSGAWAKEGAFAAAWKYLIYVRAMREVAQSKGLKSGASAKIYNYVRDHQAGVEKNPIGTLLSYLKRMEGVKLGKYGAGLRVQELQSLYKLEEIAPLISALDEVASKKRIVILVDELDLGWDASEDAVAFVAGLFRAAMAVNQETRVRVLVSLRKELYNNIPALYEDAQKVRDVMEIIEWDEERLLRLIARRIKHNAGIDLAECSDEDAWNLVFSHTLDYRKNKSFNYVIDRTLYRPRELIQFCTDALRVGRESGGAVPLNYTVLSEAEQKYYAERLKDIAAEFRFHYPGLSSVFETFLGMSYNLVRDKLEIHCLSILVGDTPVDPEAADWLKGVEPDGLIQILWDVGFLRGQAVGGQKARRRSGSRYLGSHQIDRINLRNIQRFHVHPMFRAHLGLKEAKTE